MPSLTVHMLNCASLDVTVDGAPTTYFSDFTVTQPVGTTLGLGDLGGGTMDIWVLPPNTLTLGSPDSEYQYTMTQDAQQSIGVSCFSAAYAYVQWASQCPASLVITVYDSTLGIQLGSSRDYSIEVGPPWTGKIFSVYLASGHNITTIVEADSSTELQVQQAFATVASGVGSVPYSFVEQQGDQQQLSILCSSATSPPASQASLCTTIPSLGVYDQYGDYIVYYEFFSGTGVVENGNIPGNENTSYPQIVHYYDGGMSDCNAISQCLQIYQPSINGYDEWYSTIDVHYRISLNQWECVKYLGRGNPAFKNMRTSYVDQGIAEIGVNNNDVGNVYGYANGDNMAI
ncbi:hypothetical protein LTR65_003380 [Meristemomyces frigidus]